MFIKAVYIFLEDRSNRLAIMLYRGHSWAAAYIVSHRKNASFTYFLAN